MSTETHVDQDSAQAQNNAIPLRPRKRWKRLVIELTDDRTEAGVQLLRTAGPLRKQRSVAFQQTFVAVRENGEIDTVLLDLEELAGAPSCSVLRITTLPD